MAEINCALWNCSGVLPTDSTEEKVDFLVANTNSNLDILILVETHHKKIGDVSSRLRLFYKDFQVLHAPAEVTDPYAGIIVLVDKNLTVVQDSILLPGRLLNFKIKNEKEEYNISAIYGYPGNNASQEKLRLFTDALRLSHHVADNNIIIGDFNFVDHDLDRTNQKRTEKNPLDNSLSKVWFKFIDELDLQDPFRKKNPKKRMFSYIHTQRNSKSRLDRVYVNDENSNSILHYKHTPTPWIKAHRIVTFTVKENIERGPGFWKMNTSILSDRPFSVIVESTVRDVLDLNIPDPIERWLIFIETIRIEAQIYCSRKKYTEQKVKNVCEKTIERLEQNPLLSQSDELQEQYDYHQNKLNDWYKKQVEGYQVRIKTQPRLECGEPNISFFADLEKKNSKKRAISCLMSPGGEMKYDTEGLKGIATEYYTNLFDTKKSDEKISAKLLSNVKKTISPAERIKLDALITREELEKAVRKLQRNKTPGPDGIPAEFYQAFWPTIQDLYFEFIIEVQKTMFPSKANTSITTLVYKNKGLEYLLANYRPIALMNVDVKILTKLLSIRLMYVLPNIIHESQTAVYGRTIGNTIHLVRDIIDLANKNDEEAALLFLDQEKAFDRVSHEFLYKVLEKFGFGGSFIHWIKLLYSNASTMININGFLTSKVLLKSGVRQGCPLSPLLYVLVIEILALQLRANLNIVGFSIQGERIISSHYADDAVIKITQNRCFKEVYKDLQDYEKASGARINYEKTTGLWLGKWKNRKDDPFQDVYVDGTHRITWTNKNVKYLGVYVGNQEPAKQTFDEIIPKVKRRLHFWKPLRLPLLGKSRVIEIFHASKIFYAANFYPIPPDAVKGLTDAFIDYITFPKKKKNEVSKREMEKLREYGGIKLINLQLKSETPKIHWLVRMTTDPNLRIHLSIFDALIGEQIGQLRARDIIFTEKSYIKMCKFKNTFYREAFQGIAKLNTFKHMSDLNDEHLFYNPIFTTTTSEEDMHDTTLTPFRGNRTLSGIRTYGDLIAAETTLEDPRLTAAVRRKKHSIHHIRENVDSDLIMGLNDGKPIKFKYLTQKIIYSELLHEQSTDHPYKTKWALERGLYLIDWDRVWDSIHVQFCTEEVKSTIWEQIHLNFYTTYSYNKWHNTMQPCPLCRKIPDDIFHIILDCKFTEVMWKRIEKVLYQIIPQLPTLHEKAFGLQPRNIKEKYPTILRNWITFSLRHLIMSEERKAYKAQNYSSTSFQKFFSKFNYATRDELKTKKLLYDFRGLPGKFEQIVTTGNAIATISNGEFLWKDIM
jgi:exonuclease III